MKRYDYLINKREQRYKKGKRLSEEEDEELRRLRPNVFTSILTMFELLHETIHTNKEKRAHAKMHQTGGADTPNADARAAEAAAQAAQLKQEIARMTELEDSLLPLLTQIILYIEENKKKKRKENGQEEDEDEEEKYPDIGTSAKNTLVLAVRRIKKWWNDLIQGGTSDLSAEINLKAAIPQLADNAGDMNRIADIADQAIETIDEPLKRIEKLLSNDVRDIASSSVEGIMNALSLIPGIGTTLQLWRLLQNVIVIMSKSVTTMAGAKNEGVHLKTGVEELQGQLDDVQGQAAALGNMVPPGMPGMPAMPGAPGGAPGGAEGAAPGGAAPGGAEGAAPGGAEGAAAAGAAPGAAEGAAAAGAAPGGAAPGGAAPGGAAPGGAAPGGAAPGGAAPGGAAPGGAAPDLGALAGAAGVPGGAAGLGALAGAAAGPAGLGNLGALAGAAGGLLGAAGAGAGAGAGGDLSPDTIKNAVQFTVKFVGDLTKLLKKGDANAIVPFLVDTVSGLATKAGTNPDAVAKKIEQSITQSMQAGTPLNSVLQNALMLTGMPPAEVNRSLGAVNAGLKASGLDAKSIKDIIGLAKDKKKLESLISIGKDLNDMSNQIASGKEISPFAFGKLAIKAVGVIGVGNAFKLGKGVMGAAGARGVKLFGGGGDGDSDGDGNSRSDRHLRSVKRYRREYKQSLREIKKTRKRILRCIRNLI